MKISHTEQLAKCLATEDISVYHDRSAKSAYFDVEQRILGLPNWSTENKSVHDLLVGHEVGHALYTPQGIGETIDTIDDENASIVHSYLNVVEDVRIENLVKKKYPGLRRSFFDGYKSLVDMDMFGINDRDLTEFNLIDRINIHFKAGKFYDVPFTDEERPLVKMVSDCETWEDVVEAVRKLYTHQSQQSETDQHEQFVGGEGQDDSEGNSQSNSSQNPNDNNMQGEEGENPEEGDQENDQPTYGQGSGMNSETQENFDRNMEGEDSLFGDDCRYTKDIHMTIPNVNSDQYIIDWKTVHNDIETHFNHYNYTSIRDDARSKFKTFRQENMKTVNYLVKEFEMKRNAQQFARSSTSRTGVIDTNKLHTYKTHEDIFRRITTVPGGKNHGLIMYVDWSGSMSDCIGPTIRQVMNLAMFCQKVNIPFDVYGFTDANCNQHGYFNNQSDRFEVVEDKYNHRDMMVNNFRLRQYLSSSMKKSQFERCIMNMFVLASSFESRRFGYAHPTTEELGGTPLNDSILVTHDMVSKFRAKYQLEKVNVVYLTDGESNVNLQWYDSQWNHEDGDQNYDAFPSSGDDMHIIDPVTKQTYIANGRKRVTGCLLQSIRDRHDVEVIGFHIIKGNAHRVLSWTLDIPWEESKLLGKQLRKEKYVIVENAGYSEFYLLSHQDMDVEYSKLDVKPDASRRVLTTAFKKMNKGKLTSRVVLTRFIDLIA